MTASIHRESQLKQGRRRGPSPNHGLSSLVVLGLLLVTSAAPTMAEEQSPNTEGPFVWPGGQVALGTIVDRLQTSGGATRLATGLDRRRVAMLDFVDGSYWDGVLAVCAAFDLHIAEPSPSDIRIHEVNGHPLALSCGPVLLTTGPAPHNNSRSAGPLLIEIIDAGVFSTRDHQVDHHRMIGAYRLRCLPRWGQQAVLVSDMDWRQAQAANARSLPLNLTLFRAAAERSVNLLAVTLDDPRHNAIRLSADMQLAFIDMRSAIARVQEGQEHEVMLGPIAIQVLLTAAAEPNEAARLRLRLPPDRVMVDSLTILMLDGQQRQVDFRHDHPSESRRSAEELTLTYSISSNILPEARYRFGLTGRYTLDRWHIPLILDLRVR